MSWIDRFKAPKISTQKGERSSFKEGLWTKCPHCGEIVFQEDIERNRAVCPHCQYHFRMKARDRLHLIIEPGSLEELDHDLEPTDPLEFKDSKKYKDRIKSYESASDREAYFYGRAKIRELDIIVGCFVFEYMGGSMGSVVGEKLTRTFELAKEERKPCLLITSSGGARMQEGILSLMQMAKSTAALGRMRKAGVPLINLLTHPTTGGVAASCAMLGDVILAEPNSLIGFAGPRVIEQTIKEKLPEGFQRSEFLLEHGMLDRIVLRSEMKEMLYRIILHLAPRSASTP